MASVIRRIRGKRPKAPDRKRSVASKELIREVMTYAREELTPAGWRKRGGDIYTRELASDVIGWLGLNRGVFKRGGAMDVTPVVGVRHQPIHRLLAEVRGEKFHQYVPPTVSVHIGYVMPGHGPQLWRFEEGGPLEASVRDLVESVERHGVPWMQGLLEPDALLAALDRHPLYREYHRPAFLFVLGRVGEARQFVTSHVASIADRDDPAVEDYRQFADRFLTLDEPAGA